MSLSIPTYLVAGAGVDRNWRRMRRIAEPHPVPVVEDGGGGPRQLGQTEDEGNLALRHGGPLAGSGTGGGSDRHAGLRHVHAQEVSR